MDSSNTRRLTAKARSLREQLVDANSHCHHLRFQILSMKDILDQEKSKFSPLPLKIIVRPIKDTNIPRTPTSLQHLL